MGLIFTREEALNFLFPLITGISISYIFFVLETKRNNRKAIRDYKKSKLEEFYAILYELNYSYVHVLNLILKNHEKRTNVNLTKKLELIYKEPINQVDRDNFRKEFNPQKNPARLIMIMKLYYPEFSEDLENYLNTTRNFMLYYYENQSHSIGVLFTEGKARQKAFDILENKIKNYKEKRVIAKLQDLLNK